MTKNTEFEEIIENLETIIDKNMLLDSNINIDKEQQRINFFEKTGYHVYLDFSEEKPKATLTYHGKDCKDEFESDYFSNRTKNLKKKLSKKEYTPEKNLGSKEGKKPETKYGCDIKKDQLYIESNTKGVADFIEDIKDILKVPSLVRLRTEYNYQDSKKENRVNETDLATIPIELYEDLMRHYNKIERFSEDEGKGGTRDLYKLYRGNSVYIMKIDKDQKAVTNGRAKTNLDKNKNTSNELERLMELENEAEEYNIIPLHDYRNLEDFGFQGMATIEKFFDGSTTLEKYGILTKEETSIVFKELVKAASYLEKKHGIYHKDIKPSNILLKRNGDGKLIVRITDFANAGTGDPVDNITHTCGGRSFLDPRNVKEFNSGKDVTGGQSEMYSICATMYSAITGKNLFHYDPENLLGFHNLDEEKGEIKLVKSIDNMEGLPKEMKIREIREALKEKSMFKEIYEGDKLVSLELNTKLHDQVVVEGIKYLPRKYREICKKHMSIK